MAFFVGSPPWPSSSIFWLFVPVPGLIGVANYIVTQRPRIQELTAQCSGHQPPRHHPHFEHALASAMLLTSVFFIVVAAEKKNEAGLVYAGYGAYISTLWFMVVRLNANALLPRFLANSAVKASIAMLIGLAISRVEQHLNLDTTAVGSKALYLLIGLFHPLAMKRLRATAMTTFGVAEERARDLPLRILEGIDDGAVDVLEESGITSVQHMATTSLDEICSRTLYPRERVMDWIDQAILTVHCDGRINDLREAGIHSAQSLIIVCDMIGRKDDLYKAASDRFRLAARRLGLSDNDGLRLLSECVHQDPAFVKLDEAYRELRKPSTPASTKQQQSNTVPPAADGVAPPMGIHDRKPIDHPT